MIILDELQKNNLKTNRYELKLRCFWFLVKK
jgi:hypothetical protein